LTDDERTTEEQREEEILEREKTRPRPKYRRGYAERRVDHLPPGGGPDTDETPAAGGDDDWDPRKPEQRQKQR
jgi:hypothetical protein